MSIATIPSCTLKKLLKAVLPHACTDDTLSMINGVHVELDDNRLTLVASDRYTMGIATHAVETRGSGAAVTIPLSYAKQLVRLLPRKSMDVTLSVALDQFTAAITTEAWPSAKPNLHFGTAVREGAFPDWRKRVDKATRAVAPVGSIALAPHQVARLSAFSGLPAAVLRFAGATRTPTLVSVEDWFLMLLMPVRISEAEYADGPETHSMDAVLTTLLGHSGATVNKKAA